MDKVINIADVPWQFIDDPDFLTLLQTTSIGDALGSEKLYVNIDKIKPGGKSAKYHAHSSQEEFFIILEGEGTLRLDGETIPVSRGDALSKPAGQIAHQFINTGSSILVILDIGSREAADVATYPDEGTVLLRYQRMAFHVTDALEGWTSDPNNGD